MSFRIRVWSARAFVLAAGVSIASAGVHIVDASGQADYTTIQAAVTASVDGDIILVRGGDYAAFTIDNKALEIYADAGANVAISGGVQIVNLAAAKTLVMSSLKVTGPTTNPSTVALTLTNNAGALRFQQCTFKGGNGTSNSGYPFPAAAAGARLINDPNVSFVGCTLQGGNAYMETHDCYDCTGGAGGNGVLAQTSAVALYDSVCIGGAGGETGGYGGPGGAGYDALDWGGFASRSTFRGGAGGQADDYLRAYGGNGGDALHVEPSAGFHLFSDTYLPGPGGLAYEFPQFNGAPGQTIGGGGAANTLPGFARVFSPTTTLADDGGSISVTVFGQLGDKVYLPQSLSTSFHYNALLSGVSLLPHPLLLPIDPIAVIPASGSVTFDASLLHLPSSVDAGVAFAQGYIVDAQGVKTLGSPIDALLLRCASLAPDCNGNGRFDTCDIFQHVSNDCNANSIPDECEVDCNHNGVADSCDIANGTSFDVDHNGVPDECQQTGLIVYVDTAAPPSGNGTQAHPFQTISAGIGASFNGQTVLVADGTYTGASNRNLNFGGRNISVISAHGAASCTIDCQGADRAFVLNSGETTARIEGFTIDHGSGPAGGAIAIENAAAVVAHCTMQNCTATSAGGAMSFAPQPPTYSTAYLLVTDCTFLNCSTRGLGHGGALSIDNGRPRIVNCLFEGNTAGSQGGAVNIEVVGPEPFVVLSHCVLRGNSAGANGGALNLGAEVGTSCTIEGCLIAGNSASRGGGINVEGIGPTQGDLRISNCTLVQNGATTSGGGLYVEFQGAPSLANCIVWSSSSPTGASIAMETSSSLSVSSSDVAGGQAGVFVASGGTLQWGAGNIAANPRFVDPNGPDGDPLTLDDNDYDITIASPCIDAGDNSLVSDDFGDLDGDGDTSEPDPYDLDLAARFIDIPSVPDTGSGTAPIVDMGAYERQN